MSKKLTQRDFNEEMFDAIYTVTMTETITLDPLIETALDKLSRQGFDVPNFTASSVDMFQSDDIVNDDVDEIPELKKLVRKFTKRFQKLTGYNYIQPE